MGCSSSDHILFIWDFFLLADLFQSHAHCGRPQGTLSQYKFYSHQEMNSSSLSEFQSRDENTALPTSLMADLPRTLGETWLQPHGEPSHAIYPTPETVTWQIHNVSKLLRLWEFVTQHRKLTYLSNFPFMNTLIDFSTDSQTPFISIYSIIIRYYQYLFGCSNGYRFGQWHLLSFWHLPISLGQLYFMAQHDTPGSSCIIQSHLWESTVFPLSTDSF